MEETSKRKHLGYLDGLRGLAALFVVFHHVYLQVVEREALSGAPQSLLSFLSLGRYSVDLFIVLSGFCLMLPIVKGDGTLRGGAWSFFGRRAWRILPPYFLALLFSTLLAAVVVPQKTGTHWDISIPVTGKSVLTHFLLIHDALGEDFTINHAFWSIAVEWRIYFLFPALLWAWHRVGAIKTTIIAIISAYFIFYIYKRFDSDGLTAYYIGLFAMGMLGATISFSSLPQNSWLQNLPWKWIFYGVTLTVLVVSKARIWHGTTVPYYLQDGVLGLWAMCLLIFLSRNEAGWLYNAFSYRPLVFLGTFAYSIYLIHAPLLQVFWQYVFVPWQNQPNSMFLALSLIATPLIIGISYLFFLGCERPFLRRKPKTPDVAALQTA